MNRAVSAELLKIRTTWAWWVLLLIAVGFTTLQTVASALVHLLPEAAATGTPGLNTVTGLRNVYAGSGQGYIFTLILGILGMTTEYRHMTITSSLLAVPRRGKLVTAKMIANLIAGLGFAVVTIGVSFGSAVIAVAASGYDTTLPGLDLPQILGGALLVTTLYAVFGLGVGALIRNQVAAIVGALVWILIVESLLIQLLPQVGKWLPDGAARSMVRMTIRGGELLPSWAGLLLFIGYAITLAVMGTLITVRRDVT